MYDKFICFGILVTLPIEERGNNCAPFTWSLCVGTTVAPKRVEYKKIKIMSKRIQKGETFKANEAISYAEGGVVSKELIHNDSGSITLFSFDEGQGLSEHIAPFDALIQVIDGEMELTVEGTAYDIKAGESFIIPFGARHSVAAHKPFKMLITMIRGNAADRVRFSN